ncbi:hypothetical protein BY996DRAFT_6414047 [Phakopsora pachyrhizi]|nr:hypothetical protein BY996DRAFT_6414047 [Phakopsora pachyrhizi]
MPNLGSLETPTNLPLATAKKTIQKPGSTASTANTIIRTTRLKKRYTAPLTLNSNAFRPPLFDTLIKEPKFMATVTTISTTGKIPSSRRSDAMLLSKPAGLGAKKTKLKPSTKDCGKNGLPRVLKTQSSISSKLINPSIGSSINSRLAKKESLVVSKATIPSSIKSSASSSTLVKKGTTINVQKRRSMIEINSRCAMARTGESTNLEEDCGVLPPYSIKYVITALLSLCHNYLLDPGTSIVPGIIVIVFFSSVYLSFGRY